MGKDQVDYRWNDFELQPAKRLLLCKGEPLALGARAFDLLLALIACRDSVASKGELLELAWPGLVVEENNLSVQVSALRKLLGHGAIATVPGRGYRLVVRVELSEASASASKARPAQDQTESETQGRAVTSSKPASPSLPATQLFGREQDLAALLGFLQSAVPVTLVGMSGVGKTSLARAAAEAWAGNKHWIDLVPVRHPADINAALARGLGLQLNDGDPLPAIRQALQALQDEPTLLVLDNAEHLVQACAGLVEQLRQVPGLQILVTSQLPLALSHEKVQRLQPLAVPALAEAALQNKADAATTHENSDVEPAAGAPALLVQRIREAQASYAITPERLHWINAICRGLDGLPLALEMAATRVPLMGLQAVHDALMQRFGLLSSRRRDVDQRHQTLHNALDWSYGLLPAEEQRCLRALGVFEGSFSLDLAVAVLLGEEGAQPQAEDLRWRAIDEIGELVDRSLLSVGPEDPPRFRLLESVRSYAREQMQRAGEEAAVSRSHAVALASLLSELHKGGVPADVQALAAMDDARAAVAWARGHDLQLAATLSAYSAWATVFTTWRYETGQWMLALEDPMRQPQGRALPAEVQATWWAALTEVLTMRADPRSSAVGEHAVQLCVANKQATPARRAAIAWVRGFKQPGDALDHACARLLEIDQATPKQTTHSKLAVQGALLHAQELRGDWQALLQGYQQQTQLTREAGLVRWSEASETNAINALNQLERYDEAVQQAQEMLARIDKATAQDNASNANLVFVFSGLLTGQVMSGQLDQAQSHAERAWATGRQFGYETVKPILALLAARQGRHGIAAQLIGHFRQTLANAKQEEDEDHRRLLEMALAEAIHALGEPQVAALIDAGRALSDAAAQALLAAAPAVNADQASSRSASRL